MDEYRLYNEDNQETFKKLENGEVDGIVTSPPYNIGVERNDCYYDTGYKDDLNKSEYLDLRLSEFQEFDRIVKERGVVCYNISYSHNHPSLPHHLIVEVENNTNLELADQITWKKNTAIPFQTSPRRLSRICEQVYVFCHKGVDYETDKEVSKVNQETGQKFYSNYTNFLEAKNNDGVDTDLKATFSTELVRKLLSIYFPKGSVLYDPFMGVGTTGVACLQTGRRFIGSEINQEFFEKAKERIDSVGHKGTEFFKFE
jgi:DNA modification methylase